MTEMIEAKIPATCISQFTALMNKLIRKCAKLKLPAPSYKIGKITVSEVQIGSSINTWGFDYFDSGTNRDIEKIKIEVYPVTVEYEEIRIPGGWKVLASIEHSGTKWNIINGKLDNIEEYKTMALRCDHCGFVRNRKKVIIVENNEGNREVVGSQCVKDYMGVPVSTAVFACDLEKYIFDLCHPKELRGEGDEGGYGFSIPNGVSCELTAVMTAYALRNSNWVYHKSLPDSMEMSTVSTVQNLIYTMIGTDADQRKCLQDKIEEVDINNAKKFLKMMKEKFPASKIESADQSFEYMTALMLEADQVWFKKMGIFVGAFGYMISQEMRSTVQKIDPALSEFIGKIGDKKVALDIIWDRFKWIDSNFSEDGCLICSGHISGTNNCVTWFRNGNKNDDIVKMDDEVPVVNGAIVKVTATIKAHKDEGKYGKKTILKMLKERE
jgi:hypothetical protein